MTENSDGFSPELLEQMRVCPVHQWANELMFPQRPAEIQNPAAGVRAFCVRHGLPAVSHIFVHRAAMMRGMIPHAYLLGCEQSELSKKQANMVRSVAQTCVRAITPSERELAQTVYIQLEFGWALSISRLHMWARSKPFDPIITVVHKENVPENLLTFFHTILLVRERFGLILNAEQFCAYHDEAEFCFLSQFPLALLDNDLLTWFENLKRIAQVVVNSYLMERG